MSALVTAVAQGKALDAGISSYPSARTVEAARILADSDVPLLIHQPSYSMVNRWIEDGGLLDTPEDVGRVHHLLPALDDLSFTDDELAAIDVHATEADIDIWAASTTH